MSTVIPPACRICHAASNPPGTQAPEVEHYCQHHAAEVGWSG